MTTGRRGEHVPAVLLPLMAASIVAVVGAAFAIGYRTGCRRTSSLSRCRRPVDGCGEKDNDDCDEKQQQRPQQVLCECGFDLTAKSPSAIASHRRGKIHSTNLHRATSSCPLLVTAKINEYRAAIRTHVNATDVVLEVGCAEGVTTHKIVRRAKVAIGIDQRSELIAKGRQRIKVEEETYGVTKSNLHLEVADAFDVRALVRIVNEALGVSNDTEAVEIRKTREETKEALRALSSTPSGDDGEDGDENVRIGETGASAGAGANADGDGGEGARAGAGDRRGDETKNTTGTGTGTGARAEPHIKRKKRNVQFRLAGGDIERRAHTQKVTKLWLDVSGSRELRTVVDLIRILDAVFRPQLMVVKSDQLKNLVLRSYLPSSVIPGLGRGEEEDEEDECNGHS